MIKKVCLSFRAELSRVPSMKIQKILKRKTSPDGFSLAFYKFAGYDK